MDDSAHTNQLSQSRRQQHKNIRHLQADQRSVRMIPNRLEFTAERLKAQMHGGQAETIAYRGYYMRRSPKMTTVTRPW